jgi:nucleotide-binding universal stress UspA family protein
MKKIVIPIDFSDCSLNAVRYAEALAKQLDAQLHIVYVHEPEISVVATPLGLPYSDLLPLPKLVHQQMSSLRKMLHEKGDNVHTYIKQGNLTSVITELALKKHADLVVMGTEGIDFDYGSIWGSHTSDLIAEKKVPVLVVPQAYTGTIEKNTEYVFATDFKGTEFIPSFLVALAKSTHATVNVFYKGAYSDDVLVNEYELNEFEYIKEKFDGVTTRLHHSAKDNLIESVEEFIKVKNASLVIMIAHQRHFLANLFHKSVTKQMSLHTHIPFLAIPDELTELSISSVSNSGFIG